MDWMAMMLIPCESEVTEPRHRARRARADAVKPAQPGPVMNARAVEAVFGGKLFFHRNKVVTRQAGGQGFDEVGAVQPARRGGVLNGVDRAHTRGAVGKRYGHGAGVGSGAVAHAAANEVLAAVGYTHGHALRNALAVCVGNGETCQRLTNQGVEQHSCPSPDLCPLAQGGNCKPYGRLHVNLDESDEFGTFIFRTTGFNSIRTLAARLSYYHAASNGLLSCLPLQLILRGKSTTQSYRQPVYYVDLTLREGISLNEAIIQAKQIDEQSKQAGFYQEALDFTARKGFGNGRMDVDMEEGLDVVEEFYQPVEGQQIEETQPEFNIQQGLKGSVTALN